MRFPRARFAALRPLAFFIERLGLGMVRARKLAEKGERMSEPKEQKSNLMQVADINPFRAQHLSVARGHVQTPDGPLDVTIDDSESPLAWLARRKGRDGKPLIEPVQYQAGERLRADFTRANLTPQVTSSWDPSASRSRQGHGASATFSDAMVAAREQVNRALEAVGPEFADVLLDVCCFLKRLEHIERGRHW